MIDAAHIQVLIDNNTNPQQPTLQAKHGLSFLINAQLKDETVQILLDTGPSPQIIIENAKQLNIDFTEINAIVLSHGHYDHTGGLLSILSRVSPSTPILAHPNIFHPKFAYRPHLKSIGVPFSPEILTTCNGVLLQTLTPISIVNGVTTTGEIERKTLYETVTGFHTLQNNRFLVDHLIDDQSLILHLKGKGLVIICGCAHSGLINTILHAQHIVKTDTIYAVIGGFHLKNATPQRLDATTHALRELDVKLIAPCHCTGPKAIQQFESMWKQHCRPLHVGDSLRL